MRLKTRVLIIVLSSLVGLAIMGLFGLYSMRQSMMDERRAQITQLLDFADSQLKYYHGLEKSGKLSREEAQARAKEAIGSQRQGDNYFFIRTLTDDYFVWHPIPSRMGKPDDGGKQPDGRTTVQAYRDALAKSADNKAFIDLKAPKPGAQDKTVQYPKMNGALKFEPWGWMPGIGFFVDDIESRFWQQSAVFLVVAIVLLAVLATLVFKMRAVILRQLGGEPADAAESMKRIANGDLGVNIVVDKNDNDSLMASLKLMQMKLTNLTSAIQENAATLSDQVQAFDQTAKAHSEANSPETLADLLRSVKRLGKTAGILDKSIARIKL